MDYSRTVLRDKERGRGQRGAYQHNDYEDGTPVEPSAGFCCNHLFGAQILFSFSHSLLSCYACTFGWAPGVGVPPPTPPVHRVCVSLYLLVAKESNATGFCVSFCRRSFGWLL